MSPPPPSPYPCPPYHYKSPPSIAIGFHSIVL